MLLMWDAGLHKILEAILRKLKLEIKLIYATNGCRCIFLWENLPCIVSVLNYMGSSGITFA